MLTLGRRTIISRNVAVRSPNIDLFDLKWPGARVISKYFRSRPLKICSTVPVVLIDQVITHQDTSTHERTRTSPAPFSRLSGRRRGRASCIVHTRSKANFQAHFLPSCAATNNYIFLPLRCNRHLPTSLAIPMPMQCNHQ